MLIRGVSRNVLGGGGKNLKFVSIMKWRSMQPVKQAPGGCGRGNPSGGMGGGATPEKKQKN